MKRPSLQMIAAVIGLVTALALFNLVRKWDTSGSRSKAKAIGQFTAIEGPVERRSSGSVVMETVPSPRPLHDQDLIVTQKGGVATFQLNDGPTLRINENSRFVVEADPARAGSYIGTLLEGNLNVLNPGRKGSFRLFQEGREISGEDLENRRVPVIPGEVAASPSPSASPGLEIVITAPTPESSGEPTPQPSAAAEAPRPADGSILTNEDIVRTLRAQTGFFQRCYLSFIHRSGQGAQAATGQIVTSFTIQTSGKVTNAKIVRSDFKDTTLQNCVNEVIERAKFRPFNGQPIPVQEFPIALQ